MPRDAQQTPSDTTQRRYARAIAQQREKERRRPAVVPDFLARTNAFEPRTRDLSRAPDFERIYRSPQTEPIRVRGRQLGGHHRALLYALLRENPVAAPAGAIGNAAPCVTVVTDWRALLDTMGVQPHGNNIITKHKVLLELRQAELCLDISGWDENRSQAAGPHAVDAEGFSTPLITGVDCAGLCLDDRVRVEFGSAVASAFQTRHLVSLDVDQFFKLRQEAARILWAIIDGRQEFYFLHETTIAGLLNRDLEALTARERQKFRETVTRAFKELEATKAIVDWQPVDGGRRGRLRMRKFEFWRQIKDDTSKGGRMGETLLRPAPADRLGL